MYGLYQTSVIADMLIPFIQMKQSVCFCVGWSDSLLVLTCDVGQTNYRSMCDHVFIFCDLTLPKFTNVSHVIISLYFFSPHRLQKPGYGLWCCIYIFPCNVQRCLFSKPLEITILRIFLKNVFTLYQGDCLKPCGKRKQMTTKAIDSVVVLETTCLRSWSCL